MGLSSENHSCCNLLTAKEKLRQAKSNFLRLRKTGGGAFVVNAKKRKRAVRRAILSFDDSFVDEIKNLRCHA